MMNDYLESIDRSIVLAVNSCNSPFWDEFMWIVSAKLTWIPFYLLLLVLFSRKNGIKQSIFFLLGVILAVAIADLSSVHMFKEVFQRYRPSHHALLTDQLHFYQIDSENVYKGGQYGFVSSHSANFFAVCTFAYLALRSFYRRISILLISVVVLIGYSRLYLGVHYLSDVLVGGLVGIGSAFLSYRIVFLPLTRKFKKSQ